jgi:hypothetical protein
MAPITITCEICGQSALIHKVRYKYVERESNPCGLVDHVLREVQRDIECPHCGMRTQTESHRECL